MSKRRRQIGTVRNQKRVRGTHGTYQTRVPLSPCVLEQIDRHIRQTAQRFGVSRSFVVSVALAEFFGVRNQERYD